MAKHGPKNEGDGQAANVNKLTTSDEKGRTRETLNADTRSQTSRSSSISNTSNREASKLENESENVSDGDGCKNGISNREDGSKNIKNSELTSNFDADSCSSRTSGFRTCSGHSSTASSNSEEEAGPSSSRRDKTQVESGTSLTSECSVDVNYPEENDTPSSSSSMLSSPTPPADDVEAEDDVAIEESEDERCATPPFPVLSSKPVKGESFCACYQNGGDSGLYCTCGEEDSVFEWVWEEKSKSSASLLKQDLREVLFHVDFSCGTAGVRGTKPMKEDQYYWEVKMTTPVYGTDMMVGIGTADVDLDKYRHMFCSLLGKDGESWGLSYTGVLQHKSQKKTYSSKFGQGTIIGIHLDMWYGVLSFFKNRKPLGVAYVGLQGKSIFPMVCSTAARSGMKVIRCRSFKTSLQFMCCQVLRKLVPVHLDVTDVVKMPPGLRTFLYNNIGWLLQPSPLETLDRRAGEVGSRKRKFSDLDEVQHPRDYPSSNKRLRHNTSSSSGS